MKITHVVECAGGVERYFRDAGATAGGGGDKADTCMFSFCQDGCAGQEC